jgi:hypothetical protein
MTARIRCDACGQARAPFAFGPMLHDHIWQQITAPGERALCDMCMYDRAFERLGRALTLADFPKPRRGRYSEAQRREL